MNSLAEKTSEAQVDRYPPKHDTKAEQYDPKRLAVEPSARADVELFYQKLSPVGRRVIGTLLGALPSLEGPSALVVSTLSRRAKCSKLSILRHIARGESENLYTRSINSAGRRHGSIFVPHKGRCESFLQLFKADYGLLYDTKPDQYTDTKGDRYQIATDTNGDQYGSAANPTLARHDLASAAGRFLHTLSPEGQSLARVLVKERGDNEEISIIISSLARKASCSEITARRMITRGSKAGLFEKINHPQGPRYGVILRIPETSWASLKDVADTKPDQYTVTKGDQYHCDPVTKPDRYHDHNDTNQDTKHDRYPVTKPDQYPHQEQNHYLPTVYKESSDQPDTKGDRYQTRTLDRQIKNLSIWGERLLSLTRDDFSVLWPNLLRKGFGPSQIRQIVEFRDPVDLPLDDIMGALHSAEWELENNLFPETRKSAADYLFSTLKSKGTFRRSAGYVSPEERALQNAKKELKAKQEHEAIQQELTKQSSEKQEKDAFEKWHAKLSDEELQQVEKQSPMPLRNNSSRQIWHRVYWRKHVAEVCV